MSWQGHWGKDADASLDQRGVSLLGTLCMELDFDVQKGNMEGKEGRMVTLGEDLGELYFPGPLLPICCFPFFPAIFSFYL